MFAYRGWRGAQIPGVAGSILEKFPGLSMLADLAIADGKLLAQMQFIGIHERPVVEYAKDELALLVAATHAHPHPLTRKSRTLRGKFNLDVVSGIILRHDAPQQG